MTEILSTALASAWRRSAFLLLTEQGSEFWERPEQKHLGWRVFEQADS
jgi:hypothetical protein